MLRKKEVLTIFSRLRFDRLAIVALLAMQICSCRETAENASAIDDLGYTTRKLESENDDAQQKNAVTRIQDRRSGIGDRGAETQVDFQVNSG
jgi:hypothetical protein